MRVLGFSKKWSKLQKPIHTTFRFPRKDADRGRDWRENEIVQEVYHPRSSIDRELMGIAEIIKKESKLARDITHDEAIEDGFSDTNEMMSWLMESHNCDVVTINKIRLNKLTLRKIYEKHG